MSGRHDRWICVVSCLCTDGRNLRVKVTTSFKTPCSMEDAETRARAMAAEVERELGRSPTPESAVGRETELGNRLARRADPAHEIASVEVAFTEPKTREAPDRRAANPAARIGQSSGSGTMRAVSPGLARAEESDATRAPPDPADRRRRVLMVHANVELLTRVIAVFADEFEVLTATGARQGETMLAASSFDLVIASHELREGSGVALLLDAITRNPDTTCFVLTRRAVYPDVMQAMRQAAFAPRVLFEPLDPSDLLSKARSVVTLARMREATAQLHKRPAEGTET